MSETQPDLREALVRDLTRAAAGIESSRTGLGVNGGLVSNLGWLTLQNLPLILDVLAQVSALQAEVERLQRERDEAREVVALCNNSFGSYSYHTSPHPAEQIEKVKEQARSEWRRAEEALERLQKVEGEREKGRVTSSPCWSDKPEPQSVSALRATITSRTLPAGTLQIYRGIATGTTGAFMAPADVALLISEIDRLTQRLIDGPANMQECAEFCRLAREDGNGKPCLDCHPENFTF